MRYWMLEFQKLTPDMKKEILDNIIEVKAKVTKENIEERIKEIKWQMMLFFN